MRVQPRFQPAGEASPSITRQTLQPSGPCTACTPSVRPGVFTQTVDIPASCLPLPEGATADCGLTSVACSTGTPVAIGPGEVNVPITLTTPPYTQVIRAANGAVVCSFVVPEMASEEIPSIVSCPTTQGVTCTCGVGLGNCLCRISDTGTQVICAFFGSTLTTDCVACPLAARGLGGASTRL